MICRDLEKNFVEKWKLLKNMVITILSSPPVKAIEHDFDLVGWLDMFHVSSTTRAFRDGTPFTVPCEGREARFLHRSHRESNLGSSRGSPLHYRCATTTSDTSLSYRGTSIDGHQNRQYCSSLKILHLCILKSMNSFKKKFTQLIVDLVHPLSMC